MPTTKFSEEVYDIPEPAKKNLPEWFKKTKTKIFDQKEYGIDRSPTDIGPNTTIKACSPFQDALSAGYIATLPTDIIFSKRKIDNEIVINFEWMVEGDYISVHSDEQAPLIPKPSGKEFPIFKWSFNFIIKTPPGHSCIFTHPMNRHDLPFRTFSGIVETDKYPLAVQFPFQWIDKESEYMILEKGTPICQIIPFKREGWKSKKGKVTDSNPRKSLFDLRSKIVRSYKNQWWERKDFS